jgi:hypothetical protein
MKKDIAMEDVKSIALEAMEHIEQRLKEYGITLADKEDDEIYVPMCNTIEKIAKYPDYRNYN